MNGKRNHSVDTVFVLTLFCVFAVSVLLTLMLGTRSYAAIRSGSDESYYRRTAMSYIAEKVRHSDSARSVAISEFNGMHALELRSEEEGVSYSTYIYLYDGSVCELSCETGLALPDDAGGAVIGGSALSFEKLSGNLIRINYTDPDGRGGSLLVALRSKGAVV